VETWDAIRSRRNVRSYGERAIAPQDLDRILEAARRAPSAGNQQAWDFVVCTDPEQLAQLAKVGPAAGHVAGSAATIALVAPRPDDAQLRDLIWFDLGQATMSVILAAADLGIGSAHAGVGDQELARRLLGFPEDQCCALLITLGVPADRPLAPVERPNRRAFRLRAAAPPGERAAAPADQPAGGLSKVNQAPGLSRRGAMVSPARRERRRREGIGYGRRPDGVRDPAA
jgi:nitroreductase